MHRRGLRDQILKFGLVGGLCFFIDIGIYTFFCNIIGIHYLIAGVLGFTISVIINYVLSMSYVFIHREELSRINEFIIYVVLSLVGLGINEVILYICVGIIYYNWQFATEVISEYIVNIIAKIMAAAFVMVYNFVSRKLILDKGNSRQ